MKANKKRLLAVATMLLAFGTAFSGIIKDYPEGDTVALALRESAPNEVVAVDLGLPSGTKWASCNIGANSPEEYGDYYAWGETETKSVYSWDNYQFFTDKNGNGKPWTIINGNAKIDSGELMDFGYDISGTKYDVAHVKWGGDWRMPTKEQCQELVDKCKWTWLTTKNHQKGYKVTGPNGNSIFLPAAGFRDEEMNVKRASFRGGYWSSTRDKDVCQNSYLLRFKECDAYGLNPDLFDVFANSLRYGRSVRPVINGLASASMLHGQNNSKGANYEIVLSGTYDRVGDFSEGLASVCLAHPDPFGLGDYFSECGYIDKTGNLVFDVWTEPHYDFSNGLVLYWYYETGKYVYIDKSGAWLPVSFDYAEDFSDGLAVVEIDGKYGYIDTSGDVAIAATFDEADGFSDGLAVVRINGKYGYIDKSGKVAIAATFDAADGFSEGLAAVKKDNRYGYIDKTGKLMIPMKYRDARRFSNGWAAVNDGEYLYIDKKGNVVLTPSTLGLTIDIFYHDEEDGFLSAEGLAPFEKNEKWGYIDRKGKIAIPATFDKVGMFSEGLAWVELNDKYGYINTKGAWVIPAVFSWARNVSEGMAWVGGENNDDVLLIKITLK